MLGLYFSLAFVLSVCDYVSTSTVMLYFSIIYCQSENIFFLEYNMKITDCVFWINDLDAIYVWFQYIICNNLCVSLYYFVDIDQCAFIFLACLQDLGPT